MRNQVENYNSMFLELLWIVGNNFHVVLTFLLGSVLFSVKLVDLLHISFQFIFHFHLSDASSQSGDCCYLMQVTL
jgi:hypothetical protein